MRVDSSFITIYEIILLPVYLAVIYFLAKKTSSNHINNNPEYKYYLPGLFVKIGGGILFSIIYVYYYGGGDTTNYFVSSSAITRLILQNPVAGLKIMLGEHSVDAFYNFNQDTGYPLSGMFLHKADSFAIMRIFVPFNLIGLNFYLTSVVVVATFAYRGIWKFYTMLVKFYPSFYKPLAIAVLFIPSVAFWGSGYMKDTVTLTATLWLFVNIHQLFILKKKLATNILLGIVNTVLIMSLKAYILVALLPALIIYIVYSNVKIKSTFIKYIVSPLMLFSVFLLSYSAYNVFSGGLKQYGDMEMLLEKAVVTQQDLIRSEQYGENFFDIGNFAPTPQGVLSKTPIAIYSGLFRPFVWEANGLVPVISAFESTFFIVFTFYLIFSIGIGKFVRFFASESPLTVSFIVFAIFLAFAVGLTTANFGALVRYRIPLLPFYFSSLLIVYCKYKKFKVIKNS